MVQAGTAASPNRLALRKQLAGTRLLVMGGTGFLGKVWMSMLLACCPDIEHIYLVVRPRGRQLSPREGSEARFWAEVATSPAFDPLRTMYPGAAFEAYLRQKVSPIPGDVSQAFGGVPVEIRDELRGRISALVNASGVVDFNPPLDESLNVNAFGMQNLVALARDLGDVPFFHTSTCYVAGDRTGEVNEIDPLRYPFPKADKLAVEHWDPEREISECVDLVEHVRHRANDAFRQSAFLDQAKKSLTERGEPARGSALNDELVRVKRKYEEDELVAAGTERAKYWGWHNIYTYTKSIGEQILCRSGLRFTIARPAIVESAISFPSVGWNEGINTSAPVIYLALQSPGYFPAEKDSVLDLVPVDHVAAGMSLALAELLQGTHKTVYQMGTSDANPCRTERLIELVGLYKRKYYLDKAGGNPVVNMLHAITEPVPANALTYTTRGQRFFADKAKQAAGLIKKVAAGPLKPVLNPAAAGLESLAKQLQVSAHILDMFLPFMATHNYRFSCANTRAAYERLDDEEKALFSWAPDSFDWLFYFHEIHCPGLVKNVFPEIEKKLEKPVRPLRTYDHLLDLLDEVADRFDLAPALMLTHADGLASVSYRELRERADLCAGRLIMAGVSPGDLVLLSGNSSPDWVVAFFGILAVGAVAVPTDPALTPAAAINIAQTSDLKVGIVDAKARGSYGAALEGIGVSLCELSEISARATAGDPPVPPRPALTGASLASVLFTSGTTGQPKGVMLTHANFASLLASVSKLFHLRPQDRVLSVLPLHHTFEFSCGLLLPLSRGARIVYMDELSGERLSSTLREGRITAMVGVPALWQLLERRIRGQVRERGKLFETAVDAGLELNRLLGNKTGLDAGRIFFSPVHERLGGSIRYLISGGAALPPDTHAFFSGLGLHLAEGYGLTEASPVLTVAAGKPGAKPGNVGKPIPGVEIRVNDPDANGIGEVLARGPNVMEGYFRNQEATSSVVDAEGWLHTGDLGRMDHKGRLILVGRAKEVVVTAAGENIYLDDVEARLGTIDGVLEYCMVGLPDARGGERLGLLAVPEDPDADGNPDRTTRHGRARDGLKRALGNLPNVQRPTVVHLVDAPLPRTASRKPKRKDVREVLEKIHNATAPAGKGEGLAGPVGRAVAAVAGIAADQVTSGTRLKDELAFDSLMWVELAAALDGLEGGGPAVDELSRCETVSDVIALLGTHSGAVAATSEETEERAEIPAWLVPPLKSALTVAQRTLYHNVLDMRVTGKAFIPQNRPSIVISNHTSHLDMGLVKMALGPYGRSIVGLAAKDYFFEGNKWAVAYFDQLTNLAPLDRKAGFRASFDQARGVVEAGNVVLIFPEGTRSPDGSLQPFKPLVGKLALETGTDLLPIYLVGTHKALPKGGSLPKTRTVGARIGPPLQIAHMRRLTAGLRPADAARRVTTLAQMAVEALRDGQVLDISRISVEELDGRPEPVNAASRIEAVFTELKEKYDPSRVERPISWYFSLGGADGPRWTVITTATTCQVQPGRPPGGAADCVVKTSEEIFVKLVREGYVPDPEEFIAGTIKTSDIPLLIEFSRVFALSEVAS